MTNLREDETEMEDGQRTTKTHVPKSNHSTATANKSHEKNRAYALPILILRQVCEPESFSQEKKTSHTLHTLTHT
jgi:hypothetical protein